MAWDATIPADSESLRLGAQRIREFKADLVTALTTEGVFPGPDTANPVFRAAPPRGATASQPASDATQVGRLYIDTTRAAITRDNGATWDDVATMIEAGTVATFYQAAAPTGWTQVTSVNDAMMRVVSTAGGGTGGTASLINHRHTLANGSATSWETGDTEHYLSAASPTTDIRVLTQAIGSGPYYVLTKQTTAVAYKYVDMILCEKS